MTSFTLYIASTCNWMLHLANKTCMRLFRDQCQVKKKTHQIATILHRLWLGLALCKQNLNLPCLILNPTRPVVGSCALITSLTASILKSLPYDAQTSLLVFILKISSDKYLIIIICCELFLKSGWLVDLLFLLKQWAKSWNSNLIVSCA